MKFKNLFTFSSLNNLTQMMSWIVPILVLSAFLGCEEKLQKPESSSDFAQKLTCEGCHTDQVTLQKLAPGIDEPPPSSGGG